MRTKIIYAILGFLLIALLILIAYSLKKNNEKIQIISGENKIAISNIYKNPAEKFSETDVRFKKSEKYSFDYYAADNLFLIILTDNNIETTQKEAEQDFLKTLKIEAEQACKLNVKITIPYGINPELAGQDFNLSFCAD